LPLRLSQQTTGRPINGIAVRRQKRIVVATRKDQQMSDYDSTTATQRHDWDSPENPVISSERVTGTNVYNAEGNKLGSIETVMIDKVSGQVRFAVMSFGGFLGIGEKYHQLPWDGLTYDEDQGGYVVNISRAGLEGAPSYERDEVDNFDYGNESESIDSYYGGLEGFYSPEQQSRRNSRYADRAASGGHADASGIDRTTFDRGAGDMDRTGGFDTSRS
jgi:sporulation protein YlmC with PRC-barrel domain